MEGQYSLRSPAVKRLMKEAAELREPTELFFAQPLEDNLFEWHFSVRGPPDTEFEGGIYHGRIVLPAEYPMKPPSIIILTPNGRFELNKKICLSISGYHPESWQPSWSIRTALLAIIGFMPTHGAGAIGSLEYPSEERKKLAKKSLDWKCQTCGVRMSDALPPLTEASKAATAEALELAQQISFKDERERKNTSTSSGTLAGMEDETAGAPPTPQSQDESTTVPPAESPPVLDNNQSSPPESPRNPYEQPSSSGQHHQHYTEAPTVPAGSNSSSSSSSVAYFLLIALVCFMIAVLAARRAWTIAEGRSDL